jgi:hypothetical protein
MIRFLFQQHWFQSHHDFGSLFCLAAGPNLQIRVRPPQSELLEKDFRHVEIKMLARMNQRLPALFLTQCAHHWCSLHEIRPGTHYVQEVNFGHQFFKEGTLANQ